MKPVFRRLWMAAVLLPVCLQGCGGGGGSAGPGPSPQFPSPTVSPWAVGTSWTYSVVSTTGNGTTTRSVSITNPHLTNPVDNQPVLEYRDVLGTGEVVNDYYFRQATNGTVYLEGVIVAPAQSGGASTSLFVKTPLLNGGSAVVLYPSPMSYGGQIGPYNVTYFDPTNPNQANPPTQLINTTVVTGPASVTLPIGPGGTNQTLNTFVLQETDTSSSTTSGTKTTVTHNNLTYFVPAIGIIEISGNTETAVGPVGQTPTITENTILSRLTSTTMPH